MKMRKNKTWSKIQSMNNTDAMGKKENEPCYIEKDKETVWRKLP